MFSRAIDFKVKFVLIIVKLRIVIKNDKHAIQYIVARASLLCLFYDIFMCMGHEPGL